MLLLATGSASAELEDRQVARALIVFSLRLK